MVGRAEIVRVIIASPGDLEDERRCVHELFTRWNNNNPGVHLQALMWESAAVPTMGKHPQDIVDEQVVDRGDLLVALFWSKVGTPTPSAPSGTIEEIRRFIRMKGALRVMVYFCNRPLPHGPKDLNPKDLALLQEFRQDMQNRCLFQEFETCHEFEKYLYQHLDAKVPQLLEGKLLTPSESETTVGMDKWAVVGHQDEKFREPMDIGKSLAAVSERFAAQMDALDQEAGGRGNKYLAFGEYVYRSVAWGIEYALLLRPDEVRYSAHAKFRAIARRLKEIADAKSTDRWVEFWAQGQEVSAELQALFESER